MNRELGWIKRGLSAALALLVALTLLPTALAEGKTSVTITGATVADSVYCGAPAVLESAIAVADAEGTAVTLGAEDLIYRYVSTDEGGYDSSDAPKAVGAYTLTVSVRADHDTYEGASVADPFTISPAPLTIQPESGRSRYVGCANPTFSYTCEGAATSETPAFSGAIAGAADADDPEGMYGFDIGTLAAVDNESFLAKNYTLGMAANAYYRVSSYPSSAAAFATDDNKSDSGVYTGNVTIQAPDGYTIAPAVDAASWEGSFVKSDCYGGENLVGYYLRLASGENAGAITQQKLLIVRYDADAPGVSLYSPAMGANDAAVSANQKIILWVSEPVTAVEGKSVSLSDGASTYTAPASGAELLGGTNGAWYLRFDLSDFMNGATPLTLQNGTAYTVSSDAGAFVDGADNPTAAMTARFSTIASGALADPVSVVYTLTDPASQSVAKKSGGAFVSGQAVERGTELTFTLPVGAGVTLEKDVRIGGAVQTGVDLGDAAASGDLEVYLTEGAAAFTGTASITGTAAYGQTLTATIDNANQSDEANWSYVWTRNDAVNGNAEVARTASYQVTASDIGKTLTVSITDSVYSGALTAETGTVTRAAYSGTISAPQVASLGETSVTLVAVTGYEYSLGGTDWQTTPDFTGLVSGQSYDFYQRVAASELEAASQSSEKLTVVTISPLSGTAEISGLAQVGQTLTATLKPGNNNTGTLSYAWKSGTSILDTGASYVVRTEDLGQKVTLEITSSVQTGAVSAETAAVTKAENVGGAPNAPTLAVATPTSITLNTVSGCEYSLGGVYWQDTTTFHNLQMGASYSFVQRIKETATAKASPVSAEAVLTTVPALTGSIMSTGETRYGITLTAKLEGSNNTGVLRYTWKRGTLAVGSGEVYNIGALDIGNQISVEVSSTVQGGVVTRTFGTAAKAYFFGNTPAAPTRASRSTSKITLKEIDGYEYSLGGSSWQDSPTFSSLKAGTSYTFYQRVKATATMEASETSAALKTSTSSSSSSSSDSSSSGSSSSSGDSSSSGSSSSGGTTSGDSVLYTYTLTGDNTRILYSVLQKLAAGNQTQDVTIKQNNVDITFEKGTMSANAAQLWYDFGTTINGCIHEQTAKALAGDAYVATIHYNFEGKLPGKARVRFWLGAAQAGKTLYYYKLNNNVLEYLQTSLVDSMGWAEVNQESCSDYVFLSRDINAVATPTLSPLPAKTPLPTTTPLISATDGESALSGANGWLVAAIILLAVLLILGGIWLFVKNREEY